MNQLEEVAWKKDETPYLVFSCTKCNGFTYAKTTQKQKRCPRCGRVHTVSKILDSGEIINGISAAVDRVKEKQHELAIKELGAPPEFSSLGDFRLHSSLKTKKREIETCGEEGDYIPQFKKILIDLVELYTKVPYFVFEIFAENYNIPEPELKILLHSFQKKGVIIQDDQDYMYRINLD